MEGVKFSQFKETSDIYGDEMIPIVQEGENKKIQFRHLLKTGWYHAAMYGLSSLNKGAINSTILQEIIDSVSEKGGGIIYIPSGNYLFSANGTQKTGQHCIKMKSNVTIKGDGNTTVLLPQGNTPSGLDMFYFNDYTDADNPVYLENCKFLDFVIDGKYTGCDTYTSAGKGFMINLFKNCHWENVTVRNTDATGFGVDCPVDSSMVNCIAEGCGKKAGITDAGASGFGIGFGYAYNENLFIRGCKAINNKRFGFFFEHQRRFNAEKYTATNNFGFLISECTGIGNYHNFGGVQAINAQYKNCFSREAIQHGYMFENSDNCHALGCYSMMEKNTSFVILSSDADGGTQEVKDIAFNQCISKYTDYGAKVVQYGSTAQMTRNLIKDCFFDATITNAILTSGKMNDLILQGNVSTGAGNSLGATVTKLVNKYNSWN